MAESAASIMNKTNSNALCDILSDVNSIIQTSSLNVTGAIGEIVAQVILLLAHDFAIKTIEQETKREKKFSEAITVEQFLTALVGKQQFESIMTKQISEGMKRGLVCFTHFIKKLDNLTYEDMIPDFVARAAAIQLKDAHPHIDLVLVVVLENGELAFIVIQVKNVANPTGLNDVATSTLPPFDFYTSGQVQKASDLQNRFLGLVVSLGNPQTPHVEAVEVILQRASRYHTQEIKCTNFILHGLNITTYPCLNQSVVEKLQQLACCDRSNVESMKNIYGKEVLQRVAMGCAKY